ncbi:hypothetical protein ES705_00116 [subsurface metagenome]
MLFITGTVTEFLWILLSGIMDCFGRNDIGGIDPADTRNEKENSGFFISQIKVD